MPKVIIGKKLLISFVGQQFVIKCLIRPKRDSFVKPAMMNLIWFCNTVNRFFLS